MLPDCTERIYFSMKQNFKQYRWLFCLVMSVCIIEIYRYIDNRVLIDLGRYYQSIPDWWVFFDTWNLQILMTCSRQFAGWLNAILAFWTWMGTSPEMVFAGYAVVTCGLFWWSLRHERTLSLLFLMMQPIWQVGWRTQWIHALETSLLLMVWQGCRTHQSRIWIGWLSMLTVWLRPSGIIWLTVLLVWSVQHTANDSKSSQGITVGMLLGVAMIWPNLTEYVFGKFSVPRIEMDWIDQIGRHGGLLPTVLMIGIWIWHGIRKPKNEAWMYVFWIVLGLMLSMFFGVGLDNFPLIFVGLALFCGAEVDLPRFQWAVVSVCVLLNILPFVQGIPPVFSPFFHPNLIRETPFDFQRPVQQEDGVPKVQDVHDLLKDVCQQVRPHCIVVTTGSLFHPQRESLGRLALLSPDLKHIRIEKSELWYRRPQQIAVVDVAIVQQCVEQIDVWPTHFRKSANAFTESIHTWSKKSVLSTESCSWTFFVPPSY